MVLDIAKLTAVVEGVTIDGCEFKDTVNFTLIPPKNEANYGTGYYMTVQLPCCDELMLIDVRYERTTDIEILADRWMEGWYGKNAKSISKSFPPKSVAHA